MMGSSNAYEQGNELLGGTYQAEVVSVHDPDEYLLAAGDPADRDTTSDWRFWNPTGPFLI